MSDQTADARLPGCFDGDFHTVVHPQDPTYDPAVLGRYDETLGTRPNALWSYCRRCQQGFRWSVLDQAWRRWPGGLGLLPHYDDEELDELAMAIRRRMDEIGGIVPIAQATRTRSEIHHKLRILQSLLTSIMECRYQLWPPEGDYEPRVWGEGWNVLETWVQHQLDGIDRSSVNDMTLGAAAAFEAVKAHIERMRTANSADLMAMRRAQIDSSRPQPDSDNLS